MKLSNFTLTTKSSTIQFTPHSVIKRRIKAGGQSEKVRDPICERILIDQAILIESDSYNIDRFHGITRMPRFNLERNLAHIVWSKEPFELHSLVLGLASVQSKYETAELRAEDFLLATKANLHRQLERLSNHVNPQVSSDLSRKLHVLLTNAESELKRVSNQRLFHCHGDLHAGNIFVEGDSVVAVDPAASTWQFHCLPKWLELSALAASLVQLSDHQSHGKLIDQLSLEDQEFSRVVFDLFTAIKIIVRTEFESEFLNLNPDCDHRPIIGWRRHTVATMEECLRTFLDDSVTRSSSTGTQNVEVATETALIAERVLQKRREEINQKSSIYTVFCGAVIAGNIALVDQLPSTEYLLKYIAGLSVITAFLASWSFLGLVSALGTSRRAPRVRGSLFFFGWWAKRTVPEAAASIRSIDSNRLLDAIIEQNVSIALNLQFRYDTQDRGLKLLLAAMVLFTVAVLTKVIGSDVNAQALLQWLGIEQ